MNLEAGINVMLYMAYARVIILSQQNVNMHAYAAQETAQ